MEKKLTKTAKKYKGKPVFTDEDSQKYVKRNCNNCGQKYNARHWYLKQDDLRGLFCSQSCAQNSNEYQEKRNHSEEASKSSAYKNSESEYKGVTKQGNKFQARVRKDGVLHNLGYYTNEKRAALAYDRMAEQLFKNPYLNLNGKTKEEVEFEDSSKNQKTSRKNKELYQSLNSSNSDIDHSSLNDTEKAAHWIKKTVLGVLESGSQKSELDAEQVLIAAESSVNEFKKDLNLY